MPQALSRHCVLHCISNYCLSVSFLCTLKVRLSQLFPCDRDFFDDTFRETFREFLSVFAEDGLEDVDLRHEAIESGGDRGELGVVTADAFVAVAGQIDDLTGSHFGDEDVWVYGRNNVAAGKHFDLPTLRLKYQI